MVDVWGGVGSYEVYSIKLGEFADCLLAQDLIEVAPAHLIDVN